MNMRMNRALSRVKTRTIFANVVIVEKPFANLMQYGANGAVNQFVKHMPYFVQNVVSGFVNITRGSVQSVETVFVSLMRTYAKAEMNITGFVMSFFVRITYQKRGIVKPVKR